MRACLSWYSTNDTQSPKPMNIILHCLSHNIPPSHPSIYPAVVSSTNPLAFVPHPFLLQLSHSSSLACFTGTLSEDQFGSGLLAGSWSWSPATKKSLILIDRLKANGHRRRRVETSALLAGNKSSPSHGEWKRTINSFSARVEIFRL